jgi:hypothetical protein
MISKIFLWISLVAALIALAMTVHLWCFLTTKVAPTAPVAVVLGDTNNYYRKLDWEAFTNLCIMWMRAGHLAASREYELDVAISNATVILEKHRPSP